MPDIAMAVPLLAMLAVAATIDLYRHRIPNGISLGGAVIALSMHGALLGPGGIALGTLGWIVGLLCFLPLYVGGGMAAGDVKLMAAVGAFVGPVDAFYACLATLIAGGAIGIGYLARHHGSRALARMMVARSAARVTGQPAGVGEAIYSGGGPRSGGSAGRMPYAIAIAIGTAIVVLRPSFLSSLLTNGG